VEELAGELASERERLALAQAAAHIGTFDWAVQRGTVAWTSEFEALYGLPPGSFDGSYQAWIERVHPADRPAVEAAVGEAVAGGAELAVEFRVIWPDGRVRSLMAQARVIRDGEGVAQRVLGVNLDVTEQRRTEHGLRFLAQAGEALAGSLDPNLTLSNLARLAVPTLADWCAVDVAEARPGKHPKRVAVAHADPAKVARAQALQQRYPPDWNAPHGAAKVFRTGQAELYPEISEALLEASARDAEHLRVLRELGMRSAMIVPVAARGRTLGTLTFVAAESGRRYGPSDLALAEELARRAGLAVDNARLFSELQELVEAHVELNASLREAAEARDRAAAELQQQLRARDEFLSSAAHDLKNPLANMKAQAQLLQRRAARGTLQPDQIVRGLAQIDASATRMAGLVNELLDTARLQLGQPLELRLGRTDLVALVARHVSEHQDATERHSLCLEAEVPELMGEWDAERLERVLANLLGNAITYSPGGGEIVVRVGREAGSEGHWAVVAVQDRGLGIPAADLPHVFERFHRGRNVVGRIGGTGIGLAGAQSIVDSHGGTISVESQDGAGSTFTVRLPLGALEADAADPGD
jgi:signal transduction histidine kinase